MSALKRIIQQARSELDHQSDPEAVRELLDRIEQAAQKDAILNVEFDLPWAIEPLSRETFHLIYMAAGKFAAGWLKYIPIPFTDDYAVVPYDNGRKDVKLRLSPEALMVWYLAATQLYRSYFVTGAERENIGKIQMFFLHQIRISQAE